jgi:rod shape-determining protein MreC
MAGFQVRTPSKMIGARVIGEASGINTRSVLIDRGTTSGVRRGMAVVTPDGIVGKVLAVYLTASQVLAVTDPAFAAGVESQKTHVRGVMKGVGSSGAKVDYIGSGQKVEVGEMFFTSGEDRIFPRGLPAGKVISVQDTANDQEVAIEPSWTTLAPEEVLVILDVVHQEIPAAPTSEAPVYLGPDVTTASEAATPGRGTQANTLMEQYKKIGDAQKHVFGEGPPGSKPPDFNLNPNAAPATPAAKPPAGSGAPSITQPTTQPGGQPIGQPTGEPRLPPVLPPAVKPIVKPPAAQPVTPPAAQPAPQQPPPNPPRQ